MKLDGNTHDRRGRVATVTTAGTTTTFGYAPNKEITSESYAEGTLDGRTVTVGYDEVLRRSTLSINTAPAIN